MPRRCITLLIAVALTAGLNGCVPRTPAPPSPRPTPTTTVEPTTAPPAEPATSSLPPESAPPATALGTVEIRDFEGKRLDAIADQPENTIKGPQYVDRATYRLSLTGLVRRPQLLSYEQVTAMPAYRKVTKLHCIDGWEVTYLWQGVLLEDLLARAGADRAATTVIFRCADGYSESLPIAYVRARRIMLAYGMNGTVLPPERGFPFQVVAEDTYGYKWAKWVTAIEVSNDRRFRGYWEQRGADNTATLPPKFR